MIDSFRGVRVKGFELNNKTLPHERVFCIPTNGPPLNELSRNDGIVETTVGKKRSSQSATAKRFSSTTLMPSSA